MDLKDHPLKSAFSGWRLGLLIGTLIGLLASSEPAFAQMAPNAQGGMGGGATASQLGVAMELLGGGGRALGGALGAGPGAAGTGEGGAEEGGVHPRPQPLAATPFTRVHPSRLTDDLDAAPQPRARPQSDAGGRRLGGRLGGQALGQNQQQAEQTHPVPPEGELRQFGYDLFSGTPSTFAPVTSMPVPSDYVIGPGDGIQVQLTGARFETHGVTVDQEGMVSFPKLGLIPVMGLTFAEFKEMIAERVANQMIGREVSHVTMGPLRSIRIFILGEAFRPGSYTVSALSSMTNALFVSGGVTPLGSLRRIQLKRDDAVIATLDLYDLLLRGDTSDDARLQPGDVLFVPPIGSTVGVEGQVRRPAIYELNGERTVKQVVNMAGGFLPTAFETGVQLERIQNGENRTLISLDLHNRDLNRIPVKNGDTIRIPSILANLDGVVRVSGHVHRPGGFQWRQGMRLLDVLPNVDALQQNPDLGYLLVKRETGRGNQLTILTVRFDLALANPNSAHNVPLQARDEILVFGLNEDRAETLKPWIEQLRRQNASDQLEPLVRIRGNVRFPGVYPYNPGMRMTDLIRSAAESLPGTDLDYALVVRVLDKDGRVAPFSVRLRDILGNDGSPYDIPLQREDQILVFASSQYYEEANLEGSRSGLFARTLEMPGQGAAPGRIVEVDIPRPRHNLWGAEAPEGTPSVQPESLLSTFGPRQPGAMNQNTAPGAQILTEQNSAMLSAYPGAGGSIPSEWIVSETPSDRIRDTLIRDEQQRREEAGEGAAPHVLPSLRDRAEAEFDQYRQRQRFRRFRHTVEELPSFTTGQMPPEEQSQFTYLNIPQESPEVAEHYLRWSSRTREGLLQPVLDQLQAQATLSQPSRIVSISGMVRFPGRYPLENGMRVSDLIRAGGWLGEPAYTLDAELTRFSVAENRSRVIDHMRVVLSDVLSGSSSADTVLQAFDNLTIKPIPNWAETTRVEVLGEVRFPGNYPVMKGEQLIQLINRAGGLTEFAFPEGAIFLRENLRQRERKEMNALATRLEAELAKNAILNPRQGSMIDSSFLMVLLDKLRAAEPQGRLAIDLPAILAQDEDDPSPVADSLFRSPRDRRTISLTLRDGDRLVIPPMSDEVTVLGEVNYPTSHQFRTGLDTDDYVDLSGGYTETADESAIYVVKANGQVRPKSTSNPLGSGWFYLNQMNVGPGDTIVVPLETASFDFMDWLTNVSTIVHNLSITAAALQTLGIFTASSE